MNASFFKDKTGHIVLWQSPNPTLIGWAIISIINYWAQSSKLAWLGTACLLIWASMELYSGVNYFRRLLGLIVLIVILVRQF